MARNSWTVMIGAAIGLAEKVEAPTVLVFPGREKDIDVLRTSEAERPVRLIAVLSASAEPRSELQPDAFEDHVYIGHADLSTRSRAKYGVCSD